MAVEDINSVYDRGFDNNCRPNNAKQSWPIDVTDVDGWLFVQVLAFLPATILGGIFGGIALFILRRIRARHLLTFAGVGFGVGLTLVILVSIPSIFSTTSIREKVQNVLTGGGFWAVGGALALTLVWFWWQSLEILRSNDRPDIR
jgi:hypothetical protein